MCAGCVWETILKPLVLPLVGWERGYPDAEAQDPVPGEPLFKVYSAAELLAEADEDELRRIPATTDTERWLRTMEAYDAVTDVLLGAPERGRPGQRSRHRGGAQHMTAAPESSPLAELIGWLQAEGYQPVRRHFDRQQWSARCPAHDDHDPSLEISEGDTQPVLLTCHGPCEFPDIVAKLKALGCPVNLSSQRFDWKKAPRRGRKRVERPPAGPYDKPWSPVPACVVETGDLQCIALYALLTLRCGKDNRRQRGWKRLAEALGVQVRTVREHALHLAERGWINIHGDSNALGAERSVEVWLRHCPVLGIVGENVHPLSRKHAKEQTVARSTHPVDPDEQPTVVRSTHSTDPDCRALNAPTPGDCGALNAPPEDDCRASNAPHSRYVGDGYVLGNGYVGTPEEEMEEPDKAAPSGDEHAPEPEEPEGTLDTEDELLGALPERFPGATVEDR